MRPLPVFCLIGSLLLLSIILTLVFPSDRPSEFVLFGLLVFEGVDIRAKAMNDSVTAKPKKFKRFYLFCTASLPLVPATTQPKNVTEQAKGASFANPDWYPCCSHALLERQVVSLVNACGSFKAICKFIWSCAPPGLTNV